VLDWQTGDRPFAPAITHPAPLETLQFDLDHGFPGNSTIPMESEPGLLEYSSLSLNIIGRLKLNMRKFFWHLKPRRSLRPRLRTSMEPKRQPTTRAALLSIKKRNTGSVNVALPRDTKAFASRVVDEMMDTFCLPDWRSKVESFDKVLPDKKYVSDWMRTQNPATKLEALRFDETSAASELKEAVAEYDFILKPQPKTSLDLKPQQRVATVQTVMFHKKKVNMVYGPMFAELDRRFRQLLRGNVLYNKRKSLEQIEHFLDTNYQHEGAWMNLENDISDYDRSHDRVAFAIDAEMWRRLGLDLEYLELWMAGHFRNVNISLALGIILYVRYQRKSGDVTTAFGNTIQNMCSFAHCYRLRNSDFCYAMFLGDDSLVRIKDSPSLRSRVKKGQKLMMDDFNFECKPIVSRFAYFCGFYVLPILGRVFIATDPLKRAVKFGRWDVPHQSGLHEHWVSYNDLMRNYDNQLVHDALAEAVVERYPRFQGHIRSTLQSLFTLKKSFKCFRNMWENDISRTWY
jgi:hypothetical protein